MSCIPDHMTPFGYYMTAVGKFQVCLLCWQTDCQKLNKLKRENVIKKPKENIQGYHNQRQPSSNTVDKKKNVVP